MGRVPYRYALAHWYRFPGFKNSDRSLFLTSGPGFLTSCWWIWVLVNAYMYTCRCWYTTHPQTFQMLQISTPINTKVGQALLDCRNNTTNSGRHSRSCSKSHIAQETRDVGHSGRVCWVTRLALWLTQLARVQPDKHKTLTRYRLNIGPRELILYLADFVCDVIYWNSNRPERPRKSAYFPPYVLLLNVNKWTKSICLIT